MGAVESGTRVVAKSSDVYGVGNKGDIDKKAKLASLDISTE